MFIPGYDSAPSSRSGSFDGSPDVLSPNTISGVAACAMTVLFSIGSYFLSQNYPALGTGLAVAAAATGAYGTGKGTGLIKQNSIDTTVSRAVKPMIPDAAAQKIQNMWKKKKPDSSAAAVSSTSTSTSTAAAPKFVARRYIGGIETTLDLADQTKHQELLYKVQKALKDCGKMEDKDVDMVIDFYEGTGYYQDVDRTKGAKTAFDIRHKNVSHPKYSEEKYQAVQDSVEEFQDFCKKLSRKLKDQSAAQIAIKDAGLEGKVSPSDVTVDFDSKTYSIKGESSPRHFKPENESLLDQIRESIDNQAYFIERYASLDDPEASRHPMGRVGNVGQVAQARLDSHRRWNPLSEAQALARKELEDTNNLLRERLEFRTDVLRVLQEDIKETQQVLEGVLAKIEESTRGVATPLTVTKAQFENHLKIVVKPIAREIETRLRNGLAVSQSVLNRRERELFEKYKACFVDVEAYVVEINKRITEGKCANIAEGITETVKELQAGVRSSAFIDRTINAANGDMKANISSSVTKAIGDYSRDESSWGGRWITDIGMRRLKEKEKSPQALTPNEKTAYIKEITDFEATEILAYLKRIHERFSRGDLAILGCIEEEIKRLQKVKEDPKLLAEEMRQAQVQKLERGGGDVSKQKERIDLSQVFVDSAVNEFVCIKYRPRIQEPSRWEKVGSYVGVSKPQTPWERFEACFEEAAIELTTKTWMESMRGIVDLIYGAPKEPSKKEKMQALFNAFALIVPEGNEGKYEDFVNAYNAKEKTSYTLPHGWRDLRQTAAKAIQERTSLKPIAKMTKQEAIKQDILDRKLDTVPLSALGDGLPLSSQTSTVNPSSTGTATAASSAKRTFNPNRRNSPSKAINLQRRTDPSIQTN